MCLKGSHLAKDCSLKIKCFKCSKWHHIALCDLEESSHSSSSFSVSNITWVDDNMDGLEICVTCFAKEICALLNNQNINLARENFPHIRNILLVDSNPNNGSLSADILIGMDYYWSINNNQVIKTKEGPIELNPKVGWKWASC